VHVRIHPYLGIYYLVFTDLRKQAEEDIGDEQSSSRALLATMQKLGATNMMC
jgi:hypothetical protein